MERTHLVSHYFLLIESLQRFYMYCGDNLNIEFPKGSGEELNLLKVAEKIQHRLIKIFQLNEDGERPYNGGNKLYNHDEHFRDYICSTDFLKPTLAVGWRAKHQNGWSGLLPN